MRKKLKSIKWYLRSMIHSSIISVVIIIDQLIRLCVSPINNALVNMTLHAPFSNFYCSQLLALNHRNDRQNETILIGRGLVVWLVCALQKGRIIKTIIPKM